jgi:ribose transport system permease protein
MQAKTANNENSFINNPVFTVSINFIRRNAGILIALTVICVILSFLSPVFLTVNNILNVLRQVSTNADIALGMTLVILTGGIDLSVGAVVAIAGTMAAGFIALNGLPAWVAIGLGLLIGIAIGFLNGFIITKTGIPQFLVTMAVLIMTRGLVYVYTGGLPIRTLDPIFNKVGSGYLGPIPLPVIYTIVLYIGVMILLNRTKLGRHIYAVGGNREAARFSGINIAKVEIAVYTIIGFLSAVTGIVLCGRMYSGQPTIGDGFEMDAIAAVVLGGTSFTGGVGTIGGTVIGVLVIGVLNNGLNILGVSSFWQLIVKGAVILLAVYIDSLKKHSGKTKI